MTDLHHTLLHFFRHIYTLLELESYLIMPVYQFDLPSIFCSRDGWCKRSDRRSSLSSSSSWSSSVRFTPRSLFSFPSLLYLLIQECSKTPQMVLQLLVLFGTVRNNDTSWQVTFSLLLFYSPQLQWGLACKAMSVPSSPFLLGWRSLLHLA